MLRNIRGAARSSVASLSLAAALFGAPVYAADSVTAGGDLACVGAGQGGIVSVGSVPDATAQPLVVPLEAEISRRGVRNGELGSLRFVSEDVTGQPADYAMMRLSKAAGRPLWVVTSDGKPAPLVEGVDTAGMTLEKAFDAISGAAGLRWKFDGDKVYLLNRREWTILLPSDRDLAIAVGEAIRTRGGENVAVSKGVIHFAGDDARAREVSGIVAEVYRQPRIDPFDVTWYRVWPANGEIDWSGLAERTEAVRDIGFAGRGVSMVIDGDAGATIELFLSREGTVRSLGTATMVAPAAGVDVSRVAGCGAQVDAARGITLGARADGLPTGKAEVHYALTGSAGDTSGSTIVSGDETLVVASGSPSDGSFLVALVRPRTVEVSRGGATAYTGAGSSAPSIRYDEVAAR